MMAIGVPKLVVRRLFLFLDERQQRVKLGSSLSFWAWITGTLDFYYHIDDLKPSCIISKFMDDVTLTEIITKGSVSADSNMTHYINHLELWSNNNSMKMNFKKMKEIILGSIQKILHLRSVLVEM